MKRIVTGILFAVILLVLVGMMEECDPGNVEAFYKKIAVWVSERVQFFGLARWR